jgi:Family of unknown function (DUF6352)
VSNKRDFWLSCGHHLLDRDAGGWLLIGNDFLKAYLARPEVDPPPEACAAERTLHACLLADPLRPVLASEIAEIVDADARENWQLMITFRNYLVDHATLEAAYLNLVRQRLKLPHLFLNQLVHLILRNALDGCDDAFVLRAAELFFRPQKMTVHEGSLLAIDEETFSGISTGPVSSLVTMLGLPAVAKIDVLNEDNANSYWERSDLFDMALDVTAGRRGVDALGQVVRRWISHLLAIDVQVEPQTAMRDVPLTWYVGLDAHGTRIGDVLWDGDVVDEETLAQVVALYRLTFCEPALVNDRVKGEPVYLILAMTADGMLRLKPQNILTGLPLRHLEVAS